MGHLRPYRGKKSQAIRNNIVLKRGEIFLEIPESGLGTAAGKFKVGDGATGYADLPYFLGDNAGAVRTVNQIQPDEAGNVTLSTVPYAENLVSPDNMEEVDTFIFRTSGGTSDITSGAANLNMIGGNCEINNGVITVASPSAFKSIGLNQFDKNSMVLNGYTINSSGAVVSQSGSYVCYAHAVGGLDTGYLAYSPSGKITKIGWSAQKPTTSSTGIIISVNTTDVTAITNNAVSSVIKATKDGYVCIVVTGTSDLVVHPKWSGTADVETGSYEESVIQIPTQDVSATPLPTASYGFPSVNNVRDEINLAQRLYIQRIGHYPYSAANLNTVKALDVDYIYDSTHIFYVLPNPITFTLATSVSSEYIANDYGTEEFLGTQVGVYTNTVYGANLRDKLRRDVVTISKQELSSSQQNQVRTNIDAAANHLVFTEAADAPNQVLLDTIISGNPMNTIMGANKRLLRRYDAQIASKAASVNGTLPDANGDITLNRVPMADNLFSPDNNENYGGYLIRTSGGTSDLSSGTAQLSYIRGTMSAYGRVAEELSGVYNTTYVPDPEETYITPSVSTIDAATWRASSLGTNSGTYTFTYNGTVWTYNNTAISLETYGIEVYGTVKNTDTIVVTYVKENRGTLQTLKPTAFYATGLNVKSGVLNNTGITSGKIASKSGSYLYYARSPYSDDRGYIAYDSNNKITNLGYVADTATPAVGKTVDSSHITLGSSISTCIVPETSENDACGWVVVECSATTSAICIHPRWSGGNDTVSEAYSTTTVAMPTKDASNNNLPYVSYGIPALGSVSDEINFDLKQYIQRIGHYAYSASNLATVQALGVDYDYDSSHIFYVLTNPIIYNLAATVSGEYTVNDYGIEYFTYGYGIGNRVNGNVLYGCHLYGQNLRDKLRRDVLTISQQTLTDAQKTQVLSNIGAASAASVTQLNNDKVDKIKNGSVGYHGDNSGVSQRLFSIKDRGLAGNTYYIFDIKLKEYYEYYFYTVKIFERWTHTGQSIINKDYYSNSYPSEIILSLSIDNKTKQISQYASSALVINPAVDIHSTLRQEIYYDIIPDEIDQNICTYRFYISGAQYGQCIIESIYGNDNASVIDDTRSEFSLTHATLDRTDIISKSILSTKFLIAEDDRTRRCVNFTIHQTPDASDIYDFSEYTLNLYRQKRTNYDIVNIYVYQPYYEFRSPGNFNGEYITTIGFNDTITTIRQYPGLIIEKRLNSVGAGYSLYISIDWDNFPEGYLPNAFVTIVY